MSINTMNTMNTMNTINIINIMAMLEWTQQWDNHILYTLLHVKSENLTIKLSFQDNFTKDVIKCFNEPMAIETLNSLAAEYPKYVVNAVNNTIGTPHLMHDYIYKKIFWASDQAANEYYLSLLRREIQIYNLGFLGLVDGSFTLGYHCGNQLLQKTIYKEFVEWIPTELRFPLKSHKCFDYDTHFTETTKNYYDIWNKHGRLKKVRWTFHRNSWDTWEETALTTKNMIIEKDKTMLQTGGMFAGVCMILIILKLWSRD